MALPLKLRLKISSLYGRLLRALLGRHVIGLLVRTNEGDVFAVDPEDNGVGGKLRRRGTYGREEVERIVKRLPPDARVLVVGAHVGSLVVQIAPSCRELAALEANPATLELLRMNLGLNGITNCKVFHVAAAEREGPIEFLMNRDNSGGSKRVPRDADYLYTYDNPGKITVPGVRLDDFLAGETFDLILMDIEGSECFALRGMPGLLARCGTLVVEFDPYTLKHVAGANSDEFVALLEPHFDGLMIPSRGESVERARFREVLGAMYRAGEVDDGLVFEKIPLETPR